MNALVNVLVGLATSVAVGLSAVFGLNHTASAAASTNVNNQGSVHTAVGLARADEAIEHHRFVKSSPSPEPNPSPEPSSSPENASVTGSANSFISVDSENDDQGQSRMSAETSADTSVSEHAGVDSGHDTLGEGNHLGLSLSL